MKYLPGRFDPLYILLTGGSKTDVVQAGMVVVDAAVQQEEGRVGWRLEGELSAGRVGVDAGVLGRCGAAKRSYDQ